MLLEKYLEELSYIADKEVVLLQSGGLDSVVLAHLYSKLNCSIHHVFIDYGQNCREKELAKAQNAVNTCGGELHIVELKLPWLKDNCTLVENAERVNDETHEDYLVGAYTGSYVPMRNHMFLSVASSLAESLGIEFIACGLDGAEDEDGSPISASPDAHPSFVRAIVESIAEGSVTKHLHGKVFSISTPLQETYKIDCVILAKELGIDFSDTWSCFSNEDTPCGTCGSCIQLQTVLNYLETTNN